MTERPLSDLMRRVLLALDELRRNGRPSNYPAPPNTIAIRMGLDRDVRRHGSGAASRGGWSGYMAPSQRILFPLTAMNDRGRGLVYVTGRPDGLSGSAYGLTDKGRAEVERLRAARDR